jgi:hypothetical protein
MKIKTFRNLWGVEGSREKAFNRMLDAGYDGIEKVLFTPAEHTEMRRILRRRPAPFKGVVWTHLSRPGNSVAGHVKAFRQQLGALLDVGADSIGTIGGYDCWSADEAARYFEAVLTIGGRSGVLVTHETHRNSALYHPAVARSVLRRFPELELTCDFSHWVVACERLIDDQLDLIRLCGSRARHVHTRVGTEQAPQVADVRAPEARPYLRAFERWWDLVWTEQQRRGLEVTTACPEFGAPPYTPTLPYTGEPVADLDAVCDWQWRRQTRRFKAWSRRPA